MICARRDVGRTVTGRGDCDEEGEEGEDEGEDGAMGMEMAMMRGCRDGGGQMDREAGERSEEESTRGGDSSLALHEWKRVP